MTIEQVSSGDAFSFQASAYNKMANAANAFQANQLRAGQRTDLKFENNGVILVRNKTGSDRARYDIIALDGTIVDPTINESGYLERAAYDTAFVEDATPDNQPALVILQEPLAIDAIGQAIVLGVTRARVRENSATHKYATWTSDPSILDSVDFGPIKILSIDGGTASERFAFVELAIDTSSHRWRRVYDVSSTAASTSTITTNSDLTDFIKVGLPIRIAIDSAAGTATATSGNPVTTSFLYGIVTAATSSLITISGPPLPTIAGHLIGVYIGLPEMAAMLSMFVAGTYADATDDDLLANDMASPMKWAESRCYLVRVSAVQMTVDTGTEPSINIQLGNTNALSTAIVLGAAGTWVENDAAAIDETNYLVDFDEEVEVACTVAGGTGDAENLTVQCMLVAE